MLSHRAFSFCGAALAASLLTGCADGPLGGGPGDDARVQLRFGVSGAPSSSARFQTGGTEGLVVTGSNGTLSISDIRLVVAEFELDGDDDVNPCQATGGGDDCEDFDAGPMFVDLPLAGGPVAVGAGDVPPGVYDEVEFEVEDLDDDEENATERQRIEALRQQILAQFPDWPRDASMLVVGTFTPTGGAARPFRAFVEAEIEIELGLSPALTVAEGGTGSLDVTLDPQAIFRSGNTVLDLSTASARTRLEVEIENGFSGRGRGSDD